jgi:hypothetical protein
MEVSGNSSQQKGPRNPTGRRVALLVLLILLVAAALSMAQGFFNALEHSQDFQWSPSKVFWSRDNPYQIYLDGNIDKKIILSQIPNYAQLLYVLFLPFASMSFAAAKMAWAIVNIAFAISTALLSARSLGYRAFRA